MSDPNLYDIMPAETKSRSLVDKITTATRMAVDTAKDQLDALNTITAGENLLISMACSLEHAPQHWAHIPPRNDFYREMVTDIRETCPRVAEEPMIFLHTTHKWVLVAYDSHVLPLIFLHKAGSTRLYRVVLWHSSRWLVTIFNLLHDIYLRGPERPQAVEMDPTMKLAVGPARDPKWDVGGVYLDGAP